MGQFCSELTYNEQLRTLTSLVHFLLNCVEQLNTCFVILQVIFFTLAITLEILKNPDRLNEAKVIVRIAAGAGRTLILSS